MSKHTGLIKELRAPAQWYRKEDIHEAATASDMPLYAATAIEFQAATIAELVDLLASVKRYADINSEALPAALQIKIAAALTRAKGQSDG